MKPSRFTQEQIIGILREQEAGAKTTDVPQAREASAVLADWNHDYNTVRPHSALGNLPPAEYADRSAPEKQRHGALRYVEGSAPHPVASPASQAQMKSGFYPSLDEPRGSAQT